MKRTKKEIEEACQHIIQRNTFRFGPLVVCSIAILTEMGYINFGSRRVVAPNDLYMKLKQVDGVKKVSIQIEGEFNGQKVGDEKTRKSGKSTSLCHRVRT